MNTIKKEIEEIIKKLEPVFSEKFTAIDTIEGIKKITEILSNSLTKIHNQTRKEVIELVLTSDNLELLQRNFKKKLNKL